MRNRTVSALLLTLSLLLTVLVSVALLAFSLTPAVPGSPRLSDAEARDLERLIADNTPSRFQSSDQRELSLTGQELTLLGNFALSNVSAWQDVAVRFSIEDSQGNGWMTIPVRLGSLQLYVNLHASFAQQQDKTSLLALYVGRLRIPGPLIRSGEQLLADRLLRDYPSSRELTDLRHNIQATALTDDRVTLQLNWQQETLDQLRSQAQQVFVSDDDRERILAYYEEIRAIAEQEQQERRSSSLQAFLPPLFSLAQRRTEAGSDAIAENRALLQALSVFVNQLSVTELIPDLPSEYSSDSPRQTTTLHQRRDLSQHFVTSAALTASAGAGIAGVLANSKEMYDSRLRSGYSFSDMTANIAGMALGEYATRSPEAAALLQSAMIWAVAESDYMPVPSSELDNLSEAAFSELFVDRHSEAYNERIQQIQDWVDMLPVYAW